MSDHAADQDHDPPASFRVAAEECADYWAEYPLDFTPNSLRHLDSLVDVHWDGDEVTERLADGEDDIEDALAGATREFGSYFGETLVRSHDGEWQRGDLQWSVALRGPAGEATVNVFGVAGGAFTEDAAFYETYERVATELEL
jgi:hypothetical protein